MGSDCSGNAAITSCGSGGLEKLQSECPDQWGGTIASSVLDQDGSSYYLGMRGSFIAPTTQTNTFQIRCDTRGRSSRYKPDETLRLDGQDRGTHKQSWDYAHSCIKDYRYDLRLTATDHYENWWLELKVNDAQLTNANTETCFVNGCRNLDLQRTAFDCQPPPTPSQTPAATATATRSRTPSPTRTQSPRPTRSKTPSPTRTRSRSPSRTISQTLPLTPAQTPVPTVSKTPSPTPSRSPTGSVSFAFAVTAAVRATAAFAATAAFRGSSGAAGSQAMCQTRVLRASAVARTFTLGRSTALALTKAGPETEAGDGSGRFELSFGGRDSGAIGDSRALFASATFAGSAGFDATATRTATDAFTQSSSLRESGEIARSGPLIRSVHLRSAALRATAAFRRSGSGIRTRAFSASAAGAPFTVAIAASEGFATLLPNSLALSQSQAVGGSGAHFEETGAASATSAFAGSALHGGSRTFFPSAEFWDGAADDGDNADSGAAALAIGIGVAGAVIAALAVGGFLLWRRRRRSASVNFDWADDELMFTATFDGIFSTEVGQVQSDAPFSHFFEILTSDAVDAPFTAFE